MIKNVLFDLDGTLIDSREGIINGFIYALHYFDIKVTDRKYMEKFIGPPLDESFSKEYNFDKKQTEKAVKKYREYYSVEGVYLNKLYDGIKDVIIDLANHGKKVILATAKPLPFAERILEQHGIKQYFSFLSAYMLDGSRTTKAEVIDFALKNIEDLKLEECIMVGDRGYDIEGAKANNIQTVGVTYGFGTEQELKDAGATYIAHNMRELKSILLEK